MNEKTTLIIDDDESIGKFEQELLQRSGYAVSHSVSVSDTPVSLTRTEYAILKILMQSAGQVIAKSTLLDRISLDTPDCTESSLKTHISHLRAQRFRSATILRCTSTRRHCRLTCTSPSMHS